MQALTLFVPGLLWPQESLSVVAKGLDLPSLSWLLAKGQYQVESGRVDQILASLFAMPSPLPVASLTAAFDGLSPDTTWLRADPVHLRPEKEALVLVDSGVMSLSQAEVDALISTLNAYFAEDGLSFVAPAPDRWYVSGVQMPDASFYSVDEVIGRNVDAYLPEGDGRRHWRRWMNEVQMLLHTHPVNIAREEAGDPTVNSVWFWGRTDGQSNAVCSTSGLSLDAVFADDVLARSLALEHSLPQTTAPWSWEGLREEAGAASRVLCVLEQLRGAGQYYDALGWREGLATLEEQWFAPLCQALKQGHLSQLRLVVTGSEGRAAIWSMTRASRWQVWRRPKSIATTLAAVGS